MSTPIPIAAITPEVVAAFGQVPCLIWSGEHSAWWRFNSAGYTTQRSEAGVYTLEDAHTKTRHSGPEKKIHFERVELCKECGQPRRDQ